MNDAIVVRDRNGHTAILVGQGPTYVQLIEMRSSALTVSRLTEDAYADRGFRAIDYGVPRAARHFLAHRGGVGDAARIALEACLRADGAATHTK